MVALAVALGVVLVNPATGEGATASSSTSLTGADTAATQAAQAARSTREKVAQVADAVTARAVAVRADGAQAQVSADQLAQLDALRTQVADLVTKVQAEDAAARPDRAGVASRGGSSAERNAAPAPSSSTAVATPAPSGSSGPTTADPTSTAAALAQPSPTTSPTTSAGTSPSAATADAAPAPTASSSSTAAAPSSDASSSATLSPAAATPSRAPSGSSSPATVDTPDQVAAAIPQVLGTEDPDAAQLRDAVIALARSTAAVSAAADANRTAAKAAADAATQQAAAAAEAAARAAAAAQRAAWKTSLQGYPNGKIPASALCAPTFDSGALLRCDAAGALDSLDAAYLQAFGVHLTINDSYRSYAAQVACLSTRGWLCATPGTSHHGLGIAVDLGGGIEVPGSPQNVWMVKNAATFQFEHPAWAQPDGSKPEPWHWEYTG